MNARRSTDATGAARQMTAAGEAFKEAKARVIAEFEREYLCDLLRQTGGNVSLAARIAGKERSRFNRLVLKHQLRARDFRDAASTPSRS